MASIRDYYLLVKPGIVYGNLLHTIAGSLFGLAVVGDGWVKLVLCAVGVAFVIASACVVNNVTDVSLDRHMKRTKLRPSVTGLISLKATLLFASVVGCIGFTILYVLVSPLVFWLGIISYLFYTVIYAYAKRASPIGTLVGTIPGALPIVAGYAAITNSIDVLAVGLGLLLVAWQMVHFYAIAIFRKDEYARAGVPVITSRRSFDQVRTSMRAWSILYISIGFVLVALQYINVVSGILLLGGSLYWLVVIARKPQIHEVWARKVFGVSLLLSVLMLALGAVAVVLA